MISFADARALAQGHVDEISVSIGLQCMLVDSATESTPEAFVFYYNTEAGDGCDESSARLAGNGPLIVTREDGRVHSCGSGYPTQYFLENLKRFGSAYPPRNEASAGD